MKVLVVVDMQNDFVSGSLGSDAAKQIVPEVVEKIRQYHCESDTKVFYTYDTHDADYLGTLEGTKLPVEHCIHDTEGWQLNEDILAEVDNVSDVRVYKPTFGFLDWEAHLNLDENDTIEIIGLCTDICVVSNALLLRAFFPNTKIICDASCCAGTSSESHNAALLTMKSCQIDVINE